MEGKRDWRLERHPDVRNEQEDESGVDVGRDLEQAHENAVLYCFSAKESRSGMCQRRVLRR